MIIVIHTKINKIFTIFWRDWRICAGLICGKILDKILKLIF
jgi:hypothetical protein